MFPKLRMNKLMEDSSLLNSDIPINIFSKGTVFVMVSSEERAYWSLNVIFLQSRGEKRTTYVVSVQNRVVSSLDFIALHKEIIENSYLLWFPRKRTSVVIPHTLRSTDAIFECNGSKLQSDVRIQ